MLRAAALAAFVATASLVTASPCTHRPDGLAPLHTPPNPWAEASVASAGEVDESHLVPDSYIVVLEEHADAEEHHSYVNALVSPAGLLKSSGSILDKAASAIYDGIVHKYDIGQTHAEHVVPASSGKGRKSKMKGFSGRFSKQAVEQIRRLKGVKYVERDSIVYASDVERGAPWGLARISHRKPLSFSTFNRYEYEGKGGEGVDAYVIDTGVNIKHVELEGRARWGKTIPTDPDDDLNGHGSHVAGTIASAKYGVAKKANIVAVKVLGAGGSGTMADVIAGVAWAADSASKKLKEAHASANSTHKGSVANMSLGGGHSQGLDDAVDAAVDDGLHFAVAAGNDNKDACSYSPAGSPNAITVAASTIGDARAYFSNFGPCTDVFAPGLNILSIWNTGNKSINTISGTSMASPHVAGLVAYLLSLYPTTFAPQFEDDVVEDLAARFLGEERTRSLSSYVQRGAQLVFGTAFRFVGGSAAVAPIPKVPTLTPKILKKAIIKLSTKGILTDVDSTTPNYLIFNNVTSSA